MGRIVWKDVYSIGVPVIDGEHRRLVELMDIFADAINAGKAEDVVIETLNALIVYTKTHFRHEEQMLKKARSNAFLKQKCLHVDLEKRLHAIEEMLPDQPRADIKTALEKWIFEGILPHFVNEDQAAFGKDSAPEAGPPPRGGEEEPVLTSGL